MAKAAVEEKVEKLNKTQRLIRMIKKTTAEWADEHYADNDEMGEKAKKLSKSLNALSFGVGDKERIAEMFSLLADEKVKVEKDEELDLTDGLLALVVTKPPTDKHKHSYEVGKVLLTTGDGFGIGPNNAVGSLIPPKRDFVRPATEKEIDEMEESMIKAVQKEIKIMFA